MKALSIRSPWWWYIIHGYKDIENRDWSTNFRGRILVHVGKWWKADEIDDDFSFCDSVAGTWGLANLGDIGLARGCIVGSVEIVDCISDSNSPWFFGKYGFVLRNPVAFDKPVPRKGALGFFEVPWP